MSAFIVSDTTMNFVVNTIQDFDGLRSSCFAPFLTDGEVDCNKLGNKLFQLNNDAVSQRYGNDDGVVDLFHHRSLMPASGRAEKCQRLKAVPILFGRGLQRRRPRLVRPRVLRRFVGELRDHRADVSRDSHRDRARTPDIGRRRIDEDEFDASCERRRATVAPRVVEFLPQ